jgi:hypothetical protein
MCNAQQPTEMKIYFNNLNTHVRGFKNLIHDSLCFGFENMDNNNHFSQLTGYDLPTIKWFPDKLFVRMILVVNSIKILFFYHKSLVDIID